MVFGLNRALLSQARVSVAWLQLAKPVHYGIVM